MYQHLLTLCQRPIQLLSASYYLPPTTHFGRQTCLFPITTGPGLQVHPLPDTLPHRASKLTVDTHARDMISHVNAYSLAAIC